mmetsp:Transcript_93140/g.267984  ORF Transcript_93140/g.267984 Transcript_93140/m.267984 type:complete len:1359 (-) Transcript_93140:17-4093(-)
MKTLYSRFGRSRYRLHRQACIPACTVAVLACVASFNVIAPGVGASSVLSATHSDLAYNVGTTDTYESLIFAQNPTPRTVSAKIVAPEPEFVTSRSDATSPPRGVARTANNFEVVDVLGRPLPEESWEQKQPQHEQQHVQQRQQHNLQQPRPPDQGSMSHRWQRDRQPQRPRGHRGTLHDEFRPQREAPDPHTCTEETCNGHGVCLAGACSCYDGWAGRTCNFFVERTVDVLPAVLASSRDGCRHGCSGHGLCQAGLCECHDGWTGSDCATERMCRDNCNSPSGWCVDGHCVCANGFAGATCADAICPHGCWGHGVCSEGTCKCKDGWGGPHCDMSVEPHSFVAGPLLHKTHVGGPTERSHSAIPHPQSGRLKDSQPTRNLLKPEALAHSSMTLEGSPSTAGPDEKQLAVMKIRDAVEAAGRTLQIMSSPMAEEPTPSLTPTQQFPRTERPTEDLTTVTLLAKSRPGPTSVAEMPIHSVSVEGGHPCLEADPFQPCSEGDFLPVHESTSTPSPTTVPNCKNHCADEAEQTHARVGNIAFQMSVRNVDYVQLVADPALTAAFIAKVQNALASTISEPYSQTVAPSDITIALSPGSVIVHATIAGHSQQASAQLQGRLLKVSKTAEFAKAVSAGLASLAGLESVSTGVATIDAVSDPVVVPTTPSHLDQNYSGHDCPRGCGGRGECRGGRCACLDGWSGDECDVSPCLANCSQRGMCFRGRCVCGAGFYGVACEHVRCPNDCSGNGRCNLGVCICELGFAGVGCQRSLSATSEKTDRLASGLTIGGNTEFGAAVAQLKAGPYNDCPENCNNQGRCEPDGTCSCLAGYSGIACQNSCPNGCSGHGDCANSVCVCMLGFEGPDCSVRACCSGHGSCNLPDMCICEPGWMGEQCDVLMVCPDVACSGHGLCTSGTCMCDGGWSGIACSERPPDCPPCPSEGECDRLSGLCMCGSAPCRHKLEVPLARKALRLFRGFASTPRADTSTIVPLMRHDDIDKDNLLLDASSAVYQGQLLNFPQRVQHLHQQAQQPQQTDSKSYLQSKDTKQAPPGSGFHAPTPNCGDPNGYWSDALGGCVCQGKYYGDSCERMHCSDWDPNNPDILECSGRGLCQNDGNCICAAGFGKAGGSLGENVCADAVCPVDCGQHGLCQDNKCVCQEGWQGPACRQPKCINDCSGHGQCGFLTASSAPECTCEFGYALPDCSAKALYSVLRRCPYDCHGNGLCLDGQCLCAEQYGGTDCSEIACPRGSSGPSCQFQSCLRDCDQHGTCTHGICHCDTGRTGPDCSIPEPCMEGCGHICLADLLSEECETCKGTCLTLLIHPLMGRHDPLAVRMSTLAINKPEGKRDSARFATHLRGQLVGRVV